MSSAMLANTARTGLIWNRPLGGGLLRLTAKKIEKSHRQ